MRCCSGITEYQDSSFKQPLEFLALFEVRILWEIAILNLVCNACQVEVRIQNYIQERSCSCHRKHPLELETALSKNIPTLHAVLPHNCRLLVIREQVYMFIHCRILCQQPSNFPCIFLISQTAFFQGSATVLVSLTNSVGYDYKVRL